VYRPVNARVLVLACLMVVSSAGHSYAQGNEPAGKPATTAPAAAAAAEPNAADPASEEESARPEPQRISEALTNDPPISYRLIAPPFLREKRGNVDTTALFPLFFQRKAPDKLERFVLPYYYRRSSQLNADVPLGIMWWLRGPDRNTFILPPFYTHRDKKDWALGLPPLFSTGLFGKHHHTVIPPLLTWIDGDDKNRHTFVGLYWHWLNEHAEWRGVFPFLWLKRDEVDSFAMVPPFYFRFYDDDPKRDTTIVPPFYHRVIDDTKSWGLVPLVFRKESPELKSTTVPLALFHHATGPDEFRLVTPVISYLKSKKDGRTWITPFYQRKRGDKNFDAVAPLFFHTWDNRDKSWALVLPPVYWHWEDPANDTTVVLPFYGRWFHAGISSTWVVPAVGRYKSFERDEQTWWVAPTFQYGWIEDHTWTFNIHPLLYIHKSPEKRHFALAPLWFDFENRENQTKRFVLFPVYWDFKNFAKQKRGTVAFPLYWDFKNTRKQTQRRVVFPLYWDFKDEREKKRSTVAFPLYWRFQRGDQDRTVVLNSFYEKKKDENGKHWQYHFAPFFAMGRGERERWWNVFYGLAGYDKRGKHRRIQAFWMDFELD